MTVWKTVTLEIGDEGEIKFSEMRVGGGNVSFDAEYIIERLRQLANDIEEDSKVTPKEKD